MHRRMNRVVRSCHFGMGNLPPPPPLVQPQLESNDIVHQKWVRMEGQSRKGRIEWGKRGRFLYLLSFCLSIRSFSAIRSNQKRSEWRMPCTLSNMHLEILSNVLQRLDFKFYYWFHCFLYSFHMNII
jgi:hypothetical protein